MRRKVILSISFMIILLGACNNYPSNTNEQVKQTSEKPDTIWLPGGLYIGMTENEIRELPVKDPDKYWINNKTLLKHLQIEVNQVKYDLELNLYRGKLDNVFYMGELKWKSIDDNSLKEHYNKIYSIINGLNKYQKTVDLYYKDFQETWPYSIGFKDEIFMSDLIINDEIGNFIISISSWEGNISVNWNYIGRKDNFESSLSESIYFD